MHISLGIPKYSQDETLIKNGDKDFAIQAVKEGYADVVMEQRYMGNSLILHIVKYFDMGDYCSCCLLFINNWNS